MNAHATSQSLDRETLYQAHQANTDQVKNTGRLTESAMMGDYISTYRNNIMNPNEVGFAASLFGGFDNAMGWTGRRIEQIGGATASLLSAYGDGIAETYGAYQSATPSRAEQIKDAMIASDDALFDSLGMAGLPIKGAQVVGNTIIGAAIEGVDAVRGWLNDGTDISQAAEALTMQEKGAFFAGALGEISTQGSEAFNHFMNQYGDDFKASMEEIGIQQYRLTPEQSAIFAESFDTNNQQMRQKVLDYQKEFAEKDNEGNPLWDAATEQWALSEENQALTDNVVNSITQATAAGDRVGSYLQSISGYNVASRIVTPD